MPVSRFITLILLMIVALSSAPATTASAAQSDASIVTYAYACPEGTLPSDDLATACTEPMADVFFWLFTEVAVAGQEYSDTDGAVYFSPADPGTYRIQETVPEGYANPQVICDFDRDGVQSTENLDVSDTTQVQFEYDEGDEVTCNWYNLPATTDEEAGGTEPEVECTTSQPGEPEATSSPEPGSISVTFEVTCSITTPANPDGSGTEVSDLPEDEESDSGDGGSTGEFGTLGIVVRTCEDPVDTDTSYDDLMLECPLWWDSHAWELNGEPLDDESGAPTWPVLDLGTVTVTNLDPEAEHPGIAYCTVNPIDGKSTEPVAFPVEEGTIVIEHDVPSIIYCDWFMFPG
jgi:hypothetical protein